MAGELKFVEEFPVTPAWLHQQLPVALSRARFGGWTIDPDGRRATAMRTVDDPSSRLMPRETLQAVLAWEPIAEQTTRVSWGVFDYSQGQRGASHDGAARELQVALRFALYGVPEPPPPPHDPVIAPGASQDGLFTGVLHDYSFFSADTDLDGLTQGVLPLGRWAFGNPGASRDAGEGAAAEPASPAVRHGPSLYIGDDRNGRPLAYLGALLCAPQNAGKTQLMLRWARAANRSGWNLLLIDVKGNLARKLVDGGWQGRLLRLSTGPEDGDRCNFLAGFLDEDEGLTPAATDRIRQLATALMPAEGFSGKGGEQEYFYRNRVTWMTAFIHLLLLEKRYLPGNFRHCRRIGAACRAGVPDAPAGCTAAVCDREPDLCDLYRLIRDEDLLYQRLDALRMKEAEWAQAGCPVPECGVDYWTREIAIMLSAARIPTGQRGERNSYGEYTAGLRQALEPFAPHGTLHTKVRDFGPGRLFALADLGAEPPEDPVTVLIVARQQDLINAETLLALVIGRLQHLLFDRMPLKDPRPILLLLDETRRIRGFRANEYITFAREAKAGCVLVYQSLEQIGEEKAAHEILENVGTQVYLGSLVGQTARWFLGILPERTRALISEQVQIGTQGVTRTRTLTRDKAPVLSLAELYRLPAGRWPALVYLNVPPRRRALLVDLDEDLDTRPESASRSPSPAGQGPTLTLVNLAVLDAPVRAIALRPDGELLVYRLDATLGMLALPGRATGPAVRPIPPMSGGCLAMSQEHLAVGTADGRILLTVDDGRQWRDPRVIEAHGSRIAALALCADNGLLASGAEDGSLLLTSVADGCAVQAVGDGAAIRCMVQVPGGDGLLVAREDGTLEVRTLPELAVTASAQVGIAPSAIAIHPGGTLVALASAAGLWFWAPANGQVSSMANEYGAVSAIAFDPEGRFLAAGLADGRLLLWRTADWLAYDPLTLHGNAISACCFTPDGRALISGGEDGAIRRLGIEPLLGRTPAHFAPKPETEHACTKHPTNGAPAAQARASDGR